jgi:hypothetical protein
MVASHNNGGLSYQHSLDPPNPPTPPPQPLLSLAIIISGIKSNGINFNRSKVVEGLTYGYGDVAHDIIDCCISLVLDYLIHVLIPIIYSWDHICKKLVGDQISLVF